MQCGNDCGTIILGGIDETHYLYEKIVVPLIAEKRPHVFIFAEQKALENACIINFDFLPSFIKILSILKGKDVRNPAVLGFETEMNSQKPSALQSAYKTVYGKEFPQQNYLIINAKNIPEVYRTARQQLTSENPPDAFILLSDYFAQPVYRACYDEKKNIPVTGCDNLPLAEIMVPSLTSIELNRREAGRIAAEMLLKQINGSPVEEHTVINIPANVVFRESLTQQSI